MDDREILGTACKIWANYIETYCVSMSAEDARKRLDMKNHIYEPNHLNTYQKHLVSRLRHFEGEFLSGGGGGEELVEEISGYQGKRS